MTKHKVTLLTFLMVLSLIGIMVLQFVWMRKAFIIRNELFDRSVNESIIRSVGRLETLSDVFMVHDMVVPPPPPVPPGYKGKTSNRTSNHPIGMQHNLIFNRDTIDNNIHIKKGKMPQHQIKIVQDENYGRGFNQLNVEVVTVDSILQNIEEKIDHNITVMYSNTMNSQFLDTTAMHNSTEWERRIGSKVERLKNVAGQMVFESWAWDSDFLPDTLSLRTILDEELDGRGIPIGYEFALNRSDSILIKSEGYKPVMRGRQTFSTPLYPNAIFNKMDRLTIYFPNRNAFLIRTLILPATLSLLFCAIIMATFGLSIYYIVRQKKVSEMKSDFINNMTHEFKTPLATISVATDTMINPKIINDPEKIIHYAGVIKKENLRMNHQVETILQIARLDRKDFDFQFKTTDIHELIDKAVQGIILQVENRNGFITVEKTATNPMITTDQAHTLNLLNNLLDNANKYSPETPEITLTTRNSDKGVWISVSDNGIGMNKQVQHKIFEKFYRESSGNIHNVKGFGLGLSYAKAVVDANKGDIRVISELGKGSTFEVFIPFALTT